MIQVELVYRYRNSFDATYGVPRKSVIPESLDFSELA
jgi:hypothetical protein